jgi:hypothetical protein
MLGLCLDEECDRLEPLLRAVSTSRGQCLRHRTEAHREVGQEGVLSLARARQMSTAS